MTSDPEADVQAARRLVLPKLVVTEVANGPGDGAVRVATQRSDDVTPDGCYYIRPVRIAGESERRDGLPRWVSHQYNLFPVVLGADGVPWAEASIYLLMRLENMTLPNMATVGGWADDLAAYRRFLDEFKIDWTNFPSEKLHRPTYRYNAHLRVSVRASAMALTTARRRMAAVIAFYRWVARKDGGFMSLDHQPWEEVDRYVEYKNSYGLKATVKVITTDVSIKSPKQNDPYTGTIQDGGRLRPLDAQEQAWLGEVLRAEGNTEMTYAFLMAWLSGARIQTVLTFRVEHVLSGRPDRHGEIRIPIGPGTRIDTKKDKRMTLYLPAWFYERLGVYAASDRARRRRLKARGGDVEEQYLFLSNRGSPLYLSKLDSQVFDPNLDLRHAKSGQAVRQFIKERVLPHLRTLSGTPDYHFQFHDLRATFGMNLTDAQLDLVRQGKITLFQAREHVMARLGHASSADTDRYIHFRDNQAMARTTRGKYEERLKDLAQSVMANPDAQTA